MELSNMSDISLFAGQSNPLPSTLEGISNQIKVEYDGLVEGHRRSMRHAFNMGRLLHHAKLKINEYGRFRPWIKEQKFEFSLASASLYLEIYRRVTAMRDFEPTIRGMTLTAAAEALRDEHKRRQREGELDAEGIEATMAEPVSILFDLANQIKEKMSEADWNDWDSYHPIATLLKPFAGFQDTEPPFLPDHWKVKPKSGQDQEEEYEV
jgi:hypothetical protein